MELGAGSQPWILNGRTIWIADAHRGDGRRFIVHADEKLSAFVELEAARHRRSPMAKASRRGRRSLPWK